MTISTPVPLTGAFSEWQNDEGRTRPHYEGIAQAAQLLGPDGLSSRWSDAQRQVDLDAFTFYLDPKRYRLTPADWIPRVIPADQWQVIADGVAQRIRAINRFLVDLYEDR